MTKKIPLLIPLLLLYLTILATCNKNEPISCRERPPKKEPTDKFKVVWDILIDNEISINEIFIGNKYLGVPN